MNIKLKLGQLKGLPIMVLAISPLMLIPPLASAQTLSSPIPALPPLQVELLQPDAPPPPPGVITANTISQTGISTPSLWWAEDQFDEFGGKLLTNWIAYPDTNRIDLVVSRQPWTLLDYLARYSFVNRFGTVARGYNYDVRVFNDQAALLATYTCNYTQEQPDCQLFIFDTLGQDSLPVPR